MEEWKGWKGEVEDYCEEQVPGMKSVLRATLKMEEKEVEDKGPGEKWKDKGETLWRFLKKLTAGEANQI
eukprot:1522700-Karenia_brevis.AAC.1